MIKKNLSNRLKALADFIEPNSKVIDIGCDHAWLSIFLTRSKKCHAIASDLNQNALAVAKKNVKLAGLNLEIDLRLGDGFLVLEEHEYVDYAVIAGMGGLNICKILKELKGTPNLVLQANNNLFELRKFLNENDYQIVDEVITFENKKYFVTIFCKKGHQKLTNKELNYGPILIKNSNENLNKQYFNECLFKKKQIYNKMPLFKFKNKIKLWTEIVYLSKLNKK